MERLRVDGRFLRLGGARVFLRAVTYGPFPGGWPDGLDGEFARIRAAGFDALRLYEWPDTRLLDAAARHGLRVFAGLRWPFATDFLASGANRRAADELKRRLRGNGGHRALAGVFVANEIPPDLVRWMGPLQVRRAIEDLIGIGREQRPELLWCYGNFPATEFLEPDNADLTAMNVYLEREEEFRAYLARLHHLAGDRPVVVSEFGFDSRRGGLERQATTLRWAIRAARDAGLAGLAVYAWSDRWWNAGAEVLDWDFGLTDRSGNDKPALAALRETLAETLAEAPPSDVSVIVCTRDGEERIADCLNSLRRLDPPAAEVIVVDDGSSDGTARLVRDGFPEVRLLERAPAGLSASRNAGAEAARGSIVAFTDDDCRVDPAWLGELSRVFGDGWEAVGGPNLPPPPDDAARAIVTAAPGSASHVMLDDREAEHLPGCNLAVLRSTYFAIGGFDPDFRTAGDDVDFCWRLRDAGFRIGFAPNAFVWHHRRADALAYLRQQAGYGRAEALLRRKHPQRFSPSGDARWHGAIYTGAPVRIIEGAAIYHGPMALAGYQSVVTGSQPVRELPPPFDGAGPRVVLAGLRWLAPRLRAWQRIRRFRGPLRLRRQVVRAPDGEFARAIASDRTGLLDRLLRDGWQAGGATDGWDLARDGTRVLVAVEPGEGREKLARFRHWGPADPLLDSLGRIGLASAEDPTETRP